MNPPILFRNAAPSDARELSKFAAETFRETFESFTAPTDMDLFLQTTYSEEKISSEIRDPAIETLLAFQDETLVGFAQTQVSEHEKIDLPNHSLEIKRFYVDSAFRGKGLAHEIMNRILKRARDQNLPAIWLGVYEKNFRAQNFYRKFGFKEVGSHIFHVGADPQIDLLFALSIH